MKCPNCQKFVEDTWKMCPYCRTKLSVVEKTDEEKTNPLQVYKNKAIWNIVPGEIAYHVRESELENFDQISGIIIEEGVTAYIYVDGTRVAELSSGAYEFTSREEIDKVLNERVGGLVNSSAWKWVVGLIKGKRIGDTIKEVPNISDVKSLEDVMRYARKDSVVSIYLKLNKSFPLLFDCNDKGEYQPFEIRTQLSDIKVGITLQLQVTDFNAFIPHYLVGEKQVTRQNIQSELRREIAAVLRHTLASEIIDERGIAGDVRAKIESELTGLSELLHGISITRVVDLSCNNADFDRFRALAKEIYLADREMDYMRRTQEMKNRVVSFENDQKIHEARSTYELDKALREINKDDLLSREEMRKFEKMLDAQRRISDAKSDFELKMAFNDLKRSEMLSDDEVDKIASQIQGGKIQRESINELLRIEAVARSEEAKLDMEILLTSKKNDFAREQAVSNARTEDEIERIRIQREREAADDSFARLQRMRQMQLESDRAELEMKRQDAMERKSQDYDHELDVLNVKQSHERDIHRMDTEVEIHKADSREREYALAAQKEIEAREREAALYSKMDDRYDKMMDRMERVTMAGLSTSKGRPEAPKESNAGNNDSANHAAGGKTEYFVLSMGNVPFSKEQVRSFVLAGLVKADSLIRINGQDWQAGTLSELADLFSK